LLHTATPLEPTSAASTTFQVADYNGDGVADSVIVLTSNSGTKSTEVHVLSGKGGFQTWLVHTGTPLATTTHAQWWFGAS
jgi:hypothetical protein